jgi:hypothetical protein
MPRIGWLLLGALALDALFLWLLRDLPIYRRNDAPPAAPGPTAFLFESAPPAAHSNADNPKAAPSPASSRFTVPSQTVATPAPAAVPAPPAAASGTGVPAGPAPASAPYPIVAGQTSLFNMAVPSRRVVYLVDASGSMLDRFAARDPQDPRSRYEAAVQEVRRSLAALSPDSAFDIIFFADRTLALSPTPLPPTPEARSRADAFLIRMPDGIGGGTDLLGGLTAAWKLNPDAVFLLTDGGDTDAEWKFIRAFSVLQSTAPSVRLYAFGLASPMDEDGDRFLLKLCTLTGGSYQGMESYKK